MASCYLLFIGRVFLAGQLSLVFLLWMLMFNRQFSLKRLGWQVWMWCSLTGCVVRLIKSTTFIFIVLVSPFKVVIVRACCMSRSPTPRKVCGSIPGYMPNILLGKILTPCVPTGGGRQRARWQPGIWRLCLQCGLPPPVCDFMHITFTCESGMRTRFSYVFLNYICNHWKC